jgi:hypothetical protein
MAEIHSSLKSILEEAKAELADMAEAAGRREDRAAKVIDSAMSKMKGLAEFAEQLPQKMLDRFSTVMIGELNTGRSAPQSITFCELRMNGYGVHLSGLLGRDVHLEGRYRIVTILEKID